MSYVDIAIIVIVSLCALIGLKKGLFKSVVSLFGWLVTLVVAILLTKTIAYALLDIKFVGNFVVGSDGFSLFGWVKGWGLSTDVIPGFLKSIMDPVLEPVLEGAAAGKFTVDNGLALYVTYFMYCAIVFILLFIVARIVVSLILMFFKSFEKDEKPSGISRLLGFVVGAVRGAVFAVIIMFVVNYALAIPQLNVVGDKINESVIGKPVLEQVQVMSEKFLARSDEDTISRLIEVAGLEPVDVEEGDENENENENGGNADETNINYEIIDNEIATENQ